MTTRIQNHTINNLRSSQGAAPITIGGGAGSVVHGVQDSFVSSGQGAPLPSLPRSADEQGPFILGRAQPSRTSLHPDTFLKKLTAEEIKQAAGVGGVGIKGKGTMKGEMTIRRGKPTLITGAKGSRSEVTFQVNGLKLSEAKKLVGQNVAVKGTIEKKVPWFGTITGASLVDTVKSAKLGSYQVLTGKIDNRTLFGPGGEAPPSGSYLVLDKPMKVDGKLVKEVYLDYLDMKEGEKVKLNGRLDTRGFGGVETPARSVISLSGVSNLGAGEPAFDGKFFTNKEGKRLEQLSYNRPLLMDAPARIFVLDQSSDKAFIGSMGGMMPPHMNPFHGFRGSAKIENATAADRAKVKSDPSGNPVSAETGKKLVKISHDEVGGAHYPDQMFHSWYLDEDKNTAYRLSNGGIAGFHNFVDQVIRLPE